jgi:D-tyrosyl-tRNA(Tyr) deacylase
MKIVLQRVKEARVQVEGQTVGQIKYGALLFVGIGHHDTQESTDYFVKKIIELRMFEDDLGKMNLSAMDVEAEFLLVSQFTLYGDCRKGRRPSFDNAAEPSKAKALYEYFVDQLKKYEVKVETGIFGAMMEVSLINDGPVTFILEN